MTGRSVPDPGNRAPPENEFEEIRDLIDGGLFETLRDIGFEQGEVLNLFALNPHADAGWTVASTVFQTNNSWRWNLRCDRLIPGDATLMVSFSARYLPGADETLTVRLYNTTDSEEIVKNSETADVKRHTGWASYAPTTESDEIDIRLQTKTEPAANSSDTYRPTVFFGVKI